MPNLSRNWPKRCAKKVSSIFIKTSPPSVSAVVDALGFFVAVDAQRDIGAAHGLTRSGGPSLAISTVSPSWNARVHDAFRLQARRQVLRSAGAGHLGKRAFHQDLRAQMFLVKVQCFFTCRGSSDRCSPSWFRFSFRGLDLSCFWLQSKGGISGVGSRCSQRR